jgi:hypothetical protein
VEAVASAKPTDLPPPPFTADDHQCPKMPGQNRHKLPPQPILGVRFAVSAHYHKVQGFLSLVLVLVERSGQFQLEGRQNQAWAHGRMEGIE